MNIDRIKALAKEQGKSITFLCSLLKRPKYYLNDIKKNDSDIPLEYLKILATELGTTVDYLMGTTDNPVPHSDQIKEYLPYEERGKRPIIGLTSAGMGVIAEEMILGWEYVDVEFDNENCFWLRIAGDSMSPKIDDGDLVLIQKEADIEDGDIIVAVVDGEDGYIKQVYISENRVVLHSFNPYYPDMVFEGKETRRVRFIGKAREVKRVL